MRCAEIFETLLQIPSLNQDMKWKLTVERNHEICLYVVDLFLAAFLREVSPCVWICWKGVVAFPSELEPC